MMQDYKKLVAALRNNDWSDACPCCDEAMCKDADCIILQAADAIDALQAEVKRLQDKLCDWCAVCPKELRKPEDCEMLSETPVMYGPSCEKKE